VTRRLYLVGAKVDALISKVGRRYGLSHAALNALAVIEAAGSSLPVGEVTAQMHVTRATMTSVLDTLERKGYVRRQPDPADRRRVLVDLTAEAEALLDEVLPAVQQVVAATMSGMDDQSLSQLLDAPDAAGAAIDAAPRDLPPPAARRTPARLRRT
jgi:DNA-binding MarR family transcriptional regulator